MTATRSLLLAAVLAAPASAQERAPFTVTTLATAAGAASRTVVAADVRATDCLGALRALAAACNWNITVESTPLEHTLRFTPVDLNLADQDPRVVAQLLAVAAGADCVFDEAEPVEGARTTLHVVRTPAADTESGRQRLRALAGQWYRSFLRDELRHEPLVQREAVQVRMHLGELLVESGDLEAAIHFFTEAWEQRPHDHAAAAMLRIGACHLDLARGHADRERRRAELARVEQWARRVLDTMGTAPETAPATVLLGRALIGLAATEPTADAARRHAERCQDELRARVLRLRDTAELLDVWLLAGEAQLLTERPDRVLETMRTLRGSPHFATMSEGQFLDYHFLLGYAANGAGEPELAMRSLEWFQIHAGNDPRRGTGHVLLAEAYLALQRFVQARAAAVEARTRHLGGMTPAFRQRALKVWARTALALGEKESAFQELEQLVLRGEEPALALFLVAELLADRQWQRAIAIARPLHDAPDGVGDRARFETIRALFEQALASEHLDDFPDQAIRLAPRIVDPELRSRTATMIGDAYARLGKVEHAADAYRGILR